MFKNSFSFEGRIRRTEYGLSAIITYAFVFMVSLFSGFAGIEVGVMFLLLIPAYWFIIAQGAKRCHDIGSSGWYQFIPFYGLWMLFDDSDNGINEYGPNPKGIGNQEQSTESTQPELTEKPVPELLDHHTHIIVKHKTTQQQETVSLQYWEKMKSLYGEQNHTIICYLKM